jgi:hypothetical protein
MDTARGPSRSSTCRGALPAFARGPPPDLTITMPRAQGQPDLAFRFLPLHPRPKHSALPASENTRRSVHPGSPIPAHSTLPTCDLSQEKGPSQAFANTGCPAWPPSPRINNPVVIINAPVPIPNRPALSESCPGPPLGCPRASDRQTLGARRRALGVCQVSSSPAPRA